MYVLLCLSYSKEIDFLGIPWAGSLAIGMTLTTRLLFSSRQSYSSRGGGRASCHHNEEWPSPPKCLPHLLPPFFHHRHCHCWGLGYLLSRQLSLSPIGPQVCYLIRDGSFVIWSLCSSLSFSYHSRLLFVVHTPAILALLPKCSVISLVPDFCMCFSLNLRCSFLLLSSLAPTNPLGFSSDTIYSRKPSLTAPVQTRFLTET